MTSAAPRTELVAARPNQSRVRRAAGPRSDPLGPVLALGRRALHAGAVVGFLGTLTLHGAAMAPAARSFYELQEFAQRVQDEVERRYRSEVDIDQLKPPPPPPPPHPSRSHRLSRRRRHARRPRLLRRRLPRPASS